LMRVGRPRSQLTPLAENLLHDAQENSCCIETQRRICSGHLTRVLGEIFESSATKDGEFAVVKLCRSYKGSCS